MPTPPATMNVLLVGGGGREHALAWRLRQSERVRRIFLTHPQNPGLAALGEPIDAPVVRVGRFHRLERFCAHHDVGLAVIGPEDPLAEGMADALRADGRAVLGPGAEGARLESSKSWCKALLRSANVPIAEGRAFTSPESAIAYIESRTEPVVVKASGLAKGKGVIVCDTPGEAVEAVRRMMIAREFGPAGDEVIVEERLHGEEVSVLALVDGRTIYVLDPCQDHKRLLEGGRGPNTGGMGAFCPAGVLDEAAMTRVQHDILVPTLDALRRDGIDYRGVLYAGLMLTHAGPRVLEFNARFGDPECQALLVRMQCDLADVLWRTASGALDGAEIGWEPGVSCCVVLASRGYPEKPEIGHVVEGLDAGAAVEGVRIFHAGTARDKQGRVVTAGGRVLSVVGTGATLEEARDRANRAAELVRFEGKQFRRDIGVPTVKPGTRASRTAAPAS